MIFKRILFVLILIFVVGCYKINSPKKPKNLISKDRMVDILLEIRLMTSATGVNQTVLYNNGISSYQYIYDKFNIDSVQFAQSNNYYAFQVEDYDEIYTRVRDTLELLKEKFNKLKEVEAKEKRVQDSLYMSTIKDSLALKPVLDSLQLEKGKDSIKGGIIQNKQRKGLIAPVSDTDFPDER